MGLELLDPSKFTEFIYPASAKLAPIAQSPVKYYGPDSPTPGYPANPRMRVAHLYFQLGTYLDYWTGEHEPSLSEALRDNPRPADALPPAHRAHFPQLLVTPDWPRVMLVHGSEDTAVPADSSRVMHALLRVAEVESVLRIVEGAGHGFDNNGDDVEATYGKLFDESVEFLRAVLVDA
jgi:pimeloyl-ACP methyl ester carboxylesterase